jgi:hypothetical protein
MTLTVLTMRGSSARRRPNRTNARVSSLQTDVTGLFVALLWHGPFVWIFALTIVGGLAAFVWQVVWMLRRPRPRPRPSKVRTPDPAVLHAGASFVWLAVASLLGVWLAFAEPSPNTLRIAMACGVFGLVGFLAQMVVGMEGRLLPILAWYGAYANTGYKGPVPSQHEMPWRHGQELAFLLWLFGVPALAGGLASMPSPSSAPPHGAYLPRPSSVR